MSNRKSDEFVRSGAGAETATASSGVHPARVPTFHASALGPWHAVIAYDACVRLCLHAWARGCMEAPMFLENECALLRDTFGLQQVLLQSEEELMAKRSSELTSEAAAPKPQKIIGKMKVQVRKVKTTLDPPTGCSMSSLSLRAPVIKLEAIRYRLSNFQSTISSRWQALRKIRVAPCLPANGSFSRQSLAYVHAGTQYIKQVSGLLKIGATSLRNSSSSYEIVQGMSFQTPCYLVRGLHKEGSCLTGFIHLSCRLRLRWTLPGYAKNNRCPHHIPNHGTPYCLHSAVHNAL
ncbi:hypothetical protein QQP08_023067 [Theobroma cacao]|nr:hypothetical protein QQP08_023067 [Theobroma cacao]